MTKLFRVALAFSVLGASSVALAASDENNGYAEISAGQYIAAERIIVKEQRLFRHDADLALNLAFIYAHTGRVAEARALYGQVLDRPDEMMNLPQSAPSGSHQIANLALQQLNLVQISAR